MNNEKPVWLTPVWCLDHQPGCQAHMVKGRGLVLSVSSFLAAQMSGVAMGDRVLWDQAFYRVIGIERGGGTNGIGLVLRPEPAQAADPVPVALDGPDAPESADIGDAPPQSPSGICDLDERCFEAGVIYTPYIPLQISHVNLKTMPPHRVTASEQFMRDVDAKIIEEIKRTAVDAQQLSSSNERTTSNWERIVDAFAQCERRSPTVRSEDMIAAQPLALNANGDAFPHVQWDVRYATKESGSALAETLAQETRLSEQLQRVQYVPDGSGPAAPPPVASESEPAWLAHQFESVQPGRPWWWWFTRPSVTGEADRAVYPVVRDGSKNLWVCHPHGSVKVQDFADWVPCGPVAAAPDGTQAWQQIRDLEILLEGERRARQQDGACRPDRDDHGPSSIVHRQYHDAMVERLQAELTGLRDQVMRHRNELEEWDRAWAQVRLVMDDAGVPVDWRPYPDAARVMIPMAERVAMLVAQMNWETKARVAAEAKIVAIQAKLDEARAQMDVRFEEASLRAMFDVTRHRVIRALRIEDLGSGWHKVESHAAALVAERDDLLVKLDEAKKDQGWQQVERVRAILDTACGSATMEDPSRRVLSVSEQLWNLVAERDDLLAKLDEARTVIAEVVVKVERAREARKASSGGGECDPGAAIGPEDARAILRRSVTAATDTRDWDALPTARPGQQIGVHEDESGVRRVDVEERQQALDAMATEALRERELRTTPDGLRDLTHLVEVLLDAKYWDGMPSIWQGQDRALDREALRERVAAKVHDVWARWWRYQHQTTTVVPNTDSYNEGFQNIMCWTRQMGTAYADLSEEEKRSDRVIADAYLELILGAMGVEP